MNIINSAHRGRQIGSWLGGRQGYLDDLPIHGYKHGTGSLETRYSEPVKKKKDDDNIPLPIIALELLASFLD